MSHPIIRFLDRAKETTSTTGTGTITLGGAVAGFVAIGGIGDGNSTYYTITEGNEFEVGIGTYTSSGDTLSRDQVFASSNSGSKITLAGSATVFITYPADKTVAKTSGNYVGIGIDPEYQLQVSGTGSFNTVRWADGTTQTTAATGGTSYTAGTGLNLVGTIFNASGSTTSNQGIVQLQDSLSTSTTRAITPNAVNAASGNLQSSIDTNTTNIATNVTNIAATGATNAAAIATNVTNIATNATNIAATGATNAAAIATNTTNIAATGATNAAAIATNVTNIATNATNIAATGATNAAAIATNVTNIATNATNIAATGATNAAAIVTNTTNIAATGATNAAAIATNTTNIATNATNIAATGATNAAAIATNTTNIATNVTNIAATGATNAAAIATNTTNISTNTTNIAATGATNAAAIAVNSTDIDTVSGLLSPAGNNTALQFNDSGAYGGDDNLTWNKTSKVLTVSGTVDINPTGSAGGGIWGTHFGGKNGTGTLTVSVGPKTSIHPYYGQGSSSAFFIDGAESPAITLYPSVAYKFDQSDPSNNTHPLRFYYDAAKTTAYTTNVTTNGTEGSAGAYTQIEVVGGTGTPSQLFYQCSSHAYMGNYTVQNTTNLNSNAAVSNENGLLYTFPTADASLSGYVLTSNSDGTTKWAAASGTAGSGGGAPLDAQYVTLALDGGLSDERVLVVGTGLQLTDGGANSNVTVDASGATTSNIGVVQLQDSATDGTVDKAITPNAVYDVSGVLQTNIAATGATNAAGIATNVTNIATNVTNIAATGATNAAAIVTNTTNIAATGATNAAAIATNVTDIATNVTNIAATGATNAAAIATNVTDIATNATNIAATGATNAAAISTNTTNIAATGATNAAAIATNTTNIATNATNIAATGATNAAAISTNTTNIAATGATNAAAIATNTTNIATNVTNIAATGATNAAAISTNTTNIAATGATNAAAISTNTTNIAATGATNAAAIATNTTNIATNVTNIAATGATNAAAISTNTTNIAATGATNAAAIATNTTNIATNVTNIASTGATNAAAIVTNTTNIAATGATNAAAIATNTTNIAATGATNAAGIVTVSGIAAGKDNYQYWTSTDGSNNANIETTDTVKYTGAGTVTVSLASGDPSVVTISGSGGGGAGTTYTAGTGLTLVGTEFNMYGTGALTELSITEALSTATPLTVKGAASQSADLQQWQNSAGTTLASIAPVTANDAVTMLVSGNIVSNATDADRIGVVSIGSGAYATADNSVIIGHGYGKGLVIGTTNTVSCDHTNSIAIGRGTTSCDWRGLSIAIGYNTVVTRDNCVAIGANCSLSQSAGVAIGSTAVAGGYGVAIGSYADADSSMNQGIAIGRSTSCDDGLGHGQAGISIGAYAATVDRGVAIGAGTESEGAGGQAYAEDHCIALGRKQRATNSGLMVGMESDYHMFSGHWHNASVDGNLAILNDSLSVSGDGSVKVNNQYTFPTGVTTVNDYVLTAQTDGTTAWASGAGGGATSPATPLSGVQFNDNGSFGAESNFTFNKAGSGILKVGTIVTSDTDAARIGVVSIGSGAYCGGDDSVSLGANARSSVGVNKCVSIGSAVCEDSYGVAIGDGASAHGAMGVAVGYGPRANAYSVAIGGSANCLSEYSVSIGRLSPINYDYSVGVGALTTSSAAYSTALGYNADAGNYSTCLGANSNADATRSIAIGSNQVTPISGLLIGQGADNWILSGNFNTSAASTNGNLVAGTKFGINRTSAPDAMLDVTNFAATDVGAIIQGAASQTADLTQWQDSAGVTWASVDPTGRISASGGLVLPDNTPGTTTNTLYNVGGVLNFNGSGVNGAGGGSTNAAGSDTYVQFNDGGTDFGGESNFTFSKAGSGILKVGTIVTSDTDAARIGAVSIGSGAKAGGDGAVSIGAFSSAPENSVAIGYECDAGSKQTVAIGYSTYAYGQESTAIGYDCQTNGSYAAAIGHTAVAESRAYAIGKSITSQRHGIGIGNFVNVPESGFVIGNCESSENAILSGLFNYSATSTNGYLLTSTKFGINRLSTPDAMLDVTNFAATDVGAIIQGAASQTADLTQWQDSAGVTWASVDPTGRISASGGLVLPDNTPVTTTNTLYNVGGVLNFNGSGVNGAGGAGTTYTAGTGLTLVGSEFNMYGTGALTELSITEALSTATPLTVKGAASQTADLTQWQNSAGTTLASMGMTTSNDRATLMVSGTIVSNVADAARIGVVSIGSGSYTTADNSVAIGDSAYATHFRSVSIGTAASARNTYAVAMGYDADASQTMSTAIGAWAEAVSYSTSIGCAALAPGSNAVAIGYLAEVATRSVAIGNAAVADESYSVGVGQGTSTAGQYAVSLGSSAGAGYYSIGLGAGSNANAAQSIAIGQGTLTRVSGLVIGMGVGNSILSGQFNSSTSHTDGFLNVLDNKLQVSGDGSVKVNNQYTFPTGVTTVNDYVLTAQTDGTTAWASGAGGGATSPATPLSGVQFNDNGSFGAESNFTFNKAGSGILKVGTIVTNDADAANIGAVSIGSGARVTSDYGVAIGALANINHLYNVAIGYQAEAHSAASTAVGEDTFAYDGGTAIGRDAVAYSDSVVIGKSAGMHANCYYATSLGHGTSMQEGAGEDWQMISIGYGATSKSEGAIALGSHAYASDEHSIAIGRYVVAPRSGMVIGTAADNSILSGSFNTSAASTNGYLLTSTKFGINRTSAPDAMLDVTNFAATDVGAIIQGAASQTADLTQWQDSAGVTWASVDPTGRISASGGLVLPDNTPGTTTNTLYNVGGVLNFNGSGVNGAGGGGGTPGGSDTQVQFNGGGDFEGDSALVWNSGTNVLTISGHLAATTKSFLIDHPTEPDKKLQYASLEGPENGVYVRGHTNDSIIDLPDYWTALVDQGSITVQVTAKDFAQPNLFVSGVLNNKVYLISEGAVSAYYNVSATRKDVAPLEVEI